MLWTSRKWPPLERSKRRPTCGSSRPLMASRSWDGAVARSDACAATKASSPTAAPRSAGNGNPKLHRSKVLPRIIAHSFHQTLCGQAPQDFANGTKMQNAKARRASSRTSQSPCHTLDCQWQHGERHSLWNSRGQLPGSGRNKPLTAEERRTFGHIPDSGMVRPESLQRPAFTGSLS